MIIMGVPFQQNIIDLSNCVLFVSYPIGSKNPSSQIFNLCDLAGIVPGIEKIEDDPNYLFEVKLGIRFDGSILYGNIVFTRESLDRMLADPNSHLYVIREVGRIVACASLCIFHQPFSTDATIESVVVSSKMRGRGLGRKLMEHLLAEAARMKVDCIYLTSKPKREAANALYQKMGFEKKETNCYVMKVEG